VAEVACPFCGEKGFDLVGLKQHLQGAYVFAGPCEAYENTMTVDQESEARAASQGPGAQEGGDG
jgi:hypothetical protein